MYPLQKIALIVTLMLLGVGCTKECLPKKYAIIYGISAYPHPDINLECSANDAISISRLLRKLGYETILRTDGEATKENLNYDFDSVAKVIEKDDFCLFFYSGHGIYSKTMEEICDSIVPDNYFAILLHGPMVDLKLKSYVNNNAVCFDALSRLYDKIPRSLKIGVIDACYSGAMRRESTVVDYLPDDYDGGTIERPNASERIKDAMQNYSTLRNVGSNIGFALLASSGSKEVSWDGFFSHGVFSYFLIRSAEDGDLNGDRVVTMSEAYNYIFSSVQKYWNTP